MEFNWSDFTKDNYNEYKENKFGTFDGYIGAVHIGDICVDLIDCGNGLISCDFYVQYEDTGYGYNKDGMPYDYAGGVNVNVTNDMPYEEFKNKAESFFVDHIKSYNGDYSLVEHANRPLEIW